MIAVIAGMQRSGSTYCFNVARELLKVRGGVSAVTTNSFDETLRANDDAKHLLVKTHHPDQRLSWLIRKGAALAICTVRKPEDSVASWMRTFGFGLEESVQEIGKWLHWHRGVSSSALNISFEDVEVRPLRVAYRIGMRIAPTPSAGEMLSIRRRYDKKAVYERSMNLSRLSKTGNIREIGFSYYDEETFFHRRHVSTPGASPRAEETLSDPQIEFIRRQLAEFVSPDGDYRW